MRLDELHAARVELGALETWLRDLDRTQEELETGHARREVLLDIVQDFAEAYS